MIIAFDFDGTYTADPDAFDQALRVFLDAGHTVICVTGRGDHHHPLAEDVIEERLGVPVIRANRYPGGKVEAAGACGYAVDVWIDDEPFFKRTEDGRTEGKRKQRIRSLLSRELPKGETDFDTYLAALRREGLL